MDGFKFVVARNERTSLYEVHAAGCAHLTMSKHLAHGFTTEGGSATEVAAEFESQNDGCLTKVSPCAKALK